MRIPHIIDNLMMGGGQNLLIGLAGIQQKLGHEVTVLTLESCSNTFVKEKIESEGVRVEVLTWRVRLHNPMQIWILIPWIRRFDITHVHLFPALYWAGFSKLISMYKSPLLYTEHSTKNRRRSHSFLRCVDNFIYSCCYDKIIACSNEALETFRQAYPNVKQVCAINNGVDTAKYREAKPYSKQKMLGIPEDSFVVTMVARFMFMKRQDTIVEAIKKLPSQFHTCFVGGEPTDSGLLKVKKLTEDLGVSNRVHFLYLRSDVPRILKTSDVVIMSSEYEGLSLSSIEGMAAGKPIIASRVPGLEQVVEGAGLLFEKGNDIELAEIINRLSTDEEEYKRVEERCRIRAKEYDINNMVKAYMIVYQYLMGSKYGRLIWTIGNYSPRKEAV